MGGHGRAWRGTARAGRMAEGAVLWHRFSSEKLGIPEKTCALTQPKIALGLLQSPGLSRGGPGDWQLESCHCVGLDGQPLPPPNCWRPPARRLLPSGGPAVTHACYKHVS